MQLSPENEPIRIPLDAGPEDVKGCLADLHPGDGALITLSGKPIVSFKFVDSDPGVWEILPVSGVEELSQLPSGTYQVGQTVSIFGHQICLPDPVQFDLCTEPDDCAGAESTKDMDTLPFDCSFNYDVLLP